MSERGPTPWAVPSTRREPWGGPDRYIGRGERGGGHRRLRWYGRNVQAFGICVVLGFAVLIPALVVGWGDSDEGLFYIFVAGFYFPVTGTLYLLLFALIARRSRRPRLWAYLLLPVFWGFVPIFALIVTSPTIVALWAALLLFARRVEIPGPEPSPGPGPGES